MNSTFPAMIVAVAVSAILGCWQWVEASVIVPPSETDLVKQAAGIVVGRVLAIEARQEGGLGNVWTYVTIAREEVWKGTLTQRELVIKQPGGQTATARTQIDGSPEFTVGERVLLFLTRNRDGLPRVAYLSQGKFTLFADQDTGKVFAYRDPSPPGVHIVHPEHSSRGQQDVNISSEEAALATSGFFALAPFKRRVRRTAAQQPIPAAMVSASVPPRSQALLDGQGDSSSPATTETEREARAQFTLLASPAARWFEPDSGAPVRIYGNFTNAPPGAQTALLQAAQAWSSVANSSFRFAFSGATTAQGTQLDGVNAISFGDPRHEIDPPVNCSGVLGMSRVFISGETRVLGGTSYARIIEGDTVFADGWNGCPVYANPTHLAEIVTHELGHVLGLGHATDPAATMYATAHADGRGASLRADDIAGAQTLYPGSQTGNTSACTLSLSVINRSVASGASTLTVDVRPSTNTCTWTATSNVGWITVTAGASGTGARTVALAIAATPLYQPRTGTVTIANATVTVTQAAKARRKSRG
jgi:hypothetical protein